MKREFYSNSIEQFRHQSIDEIIGELSRSNEFNLEYTQAKAWEQEVIILQPALKDFSGQIFFEYSVPRMGKRIDVLLIINGVIFILEFKVGEKEFNSSALDQVMDYALDLKNFHETSHELFIAPILIPTESKKSDISIKLTPHNDKILFPIKCTVADISNAISTIVEYSNETSINIANWVNGRYSPTPTIIDVALSLYNNHSVEDITRKDADATDLSLTTNTILEIINNSRDNNEKAICFVTGVPGAGKTLVGLDIATKHLDKEDKTAAVFLSGNGPLVAILQEALTRDKLIREKAAGKKITKNEIKQQVKAFIQIVHHFRDEYIKDSRAPFEHVTIFDEAQRAWNKKQTVSFMKRKKGIPDFDMSEPEFLISCLNRHSDWAVVICLVGGGQEINTGEAGIMEWIESIHRSYSGWKLYLSDNLVESEYSTKEALSKIESSRVIKNNDLHLSVSMRSFRAENLSNLVKCILDFDIENAQSNYNKLKNKYPILLTRDLTKAKEWLKIQARGNERYGIMVSSQAQRLKPYAIDVKSPMNPIHWFLNGKCDVRSSYFLEDIATEFHVQGLELDWTCVAWDADFRYTKSGWDTYEFKGSKWNRIRDIERKKYLKNAYRVLLTRARQGMILVVPQGDDEDKTRKQEFYDSTFEYLKEIGLQVI